MSSSTLRPEGEDSFTHELFVKNVGKTSVYIDDRRRGMFLGNRELLALESGCGYTSTPGEPAEVVCSHDYRPLVVRPNASVSLAITLLKEKPGMNHLTSERLVFPKLLVHRTTRKFSLGDAAADARTGTIWVSYEGITA